MRISNAIVLGGGIGGLATATALAQRGVAVTLLEQATEFAEVGAGLQISPNGLAVLRGLRVAPQLRETGAVSAEAVVLRAGERGREVARLPLQGKGPGGQYYFMHRVDLLRVLVTAARRANVTMELGAQVASIRPGPVPQVQLVDGSTRRAELVVAADGIHSVARPVLNGPDRARFSGQVAWRATIPNVVGHPCEAHVAMGPGCHLVSYPVRKGTRINLVAVQERETWAAEGWNHRDDPDSLRQAFAGFGGEVPQMLAAVEEVRLWGLHLHPVAEVWHQEGVALVGDAAHPTLPFLAQGANMALEDAWVLAEKAGSDAADWLAAYQEARIARVRRVVRAAERNAWRYHLRPGPLRLLAHLGLQVTSRVAPRQLVGAFDWLYGHDVTAHRAPTGAHR